LKVVYGPPEGRGPPVEKKCSSAVVLNVEGSEVHRHFKLNRSRRRNVRMQCFPLYSMLLALGNPTVDIFSLDIEVSICQQAADFHVIFSLLEACVCNFLSKGSRQQKSAFKTSSFYKLKNCY